MEETLKEIMSKLTIVGNTAGGGEDVAFITTVILSWPNYLYDV